MSFDFCVYFHGFVDLAVIFLLMPNLGRGVGIRCKDVVLHFAFYSQGFICKIISSSGEYLCVTFV